MQDSPTGNFPIVPIIGAVRLRVNTFSILAVDNPADGYFVQSFFYRERGVIRAVKLFSDSLVAVGHIRLGRRGNVHLGAMMLFAEAL